MLYFAYCFIMYCIVNMSCTIRIKLFFEPFVLYTCIDLHRFSMMQKKKVGLFNYVTYLYFASVKQFSQTLGFLLS